MVGRSNEVNDPPSDRVVPRQAKSQALGRPLKILSTRRVHIHSVLVVGGQGRMTPRQEPDYSVRLECLGFFFFRQASFSRPETRRGSCSWDSELGLRHRPWPPDGSHLDTPQFPAQGSRHHANQPCDALLRNVRLGEYHVWVAIPRTLCIRCTVRLSRYYPLGICTRYVRRSHRILCLLSIFENFLNYSYPLYIKGEIDI